VGGWVEHRFCAPFEEVGAVEHHHVQVYVDIEARATAVDHRERPTEHVGARRVEAAGDVAFDPAEQLADDLVAKAP
jgi:hypothetical protein